MSHVRNGDSLCYEAKIEESGKMSASENQTWDTWLEVPLSYTWQPLSTCRQNSSVLGSIQQPTFSLSST